MAKLEKVTVATFIGKKQVRKGDEKLLNDDGMLIRTDKKRVEKVPPLLIKTLEKLTDNGWKFESVGTGLKCGRLDKDAGGFASVCVVNIDNAKTFNIYVMKSGVDDLPAIEFKTDGSPIKGGSVKTSRIVVTGGKSKDVAKWIMMLPTRFDNGRITLMKFEKNSNKKIVVGKAEKKTAEKVEKKAAEKVEKKAAEKVEKKVKKSDGKKVKKETKVVAEVKVNRRKKVAA